jgi:hypothetical protein
MAFGNAYSGILLPFVETYKGAKNEKGRTQVVKDAVDAVLKSRDLLEDQGGNLPNDLKTVCLFHSVSISTDAHYLRPSLDISKGLLRRKQLLWIRRNLPKSNRFIKSEMSSNNNIETWLKRKFLTSPLTSDILELTNEPSPLFLKI